MSSAAVGSTVPAGAAGYWLTASDGGVFAFGDAGFFGSTGAIRLNRPIVGMAATSSGRGYWLVASDGGVFAFGDAGFFGSTGGTPLNRPIVGMAATSSGRGYRLVASDGGVFAFGDAAFFGSTGGSPLNRPIVGMAPTSSGRGYWLVASDGGVFSFGEARFFGSTGGTIINRPVVGMAGTPTGRGYWLVASDGGIFAFGDAGFFGSTGRATLNRPIVAAAPTSSGRGYRLVASDGGVFSFGDAGFYGSTGGVALNQPIVGAAQASSSVHIKSSRLHDGVAGLRYLDHLIADGGTEPFTWTGTGLPAGLALSADGTVIGSPLTSGATTLEVTVVDADGAVGGTYVSLAVPSAVPAACVAQSCAITTPNGQTTVLNTGQIGPVTRDSASQALQSITVTGASPAVGQIVVVPPVPQVPSGATVLIKAVTQGPNATHTLAVQPAGPADAYADGAVQALPPAGAASSAGRAASAAAAFGCNSNVSISDMGTGVTSTLQPSVAALWKHPFFGGGGIYVGTGGLQLFQFDLDGSITVTLRMTISGRASCKATLADIHGAVPAGPLGAVLLDLKPTLQLDVDGKIAIETSVTFRCGAEYRWNQGVESRVAFCSRRSDPPHLTGDTGATAKLTAALDASVTLDDVVGITGKLSASLTGTYRPTNPSLVELVGDVDYKLGACLACFWKGSPAQVEVVSGSLYHSTIYTTRTKGASTCPTDGDVRVIAAQPNGNNGTNISDVFSIRCSPGNEAVVSDVNVVKSINPYNDAYYSLYALWIDNGWKKLILAGHGGDCFDLDNAGVDVRALAKLFYPLDPGCRFFFDQRGVAP